MEYFCSKTPDWEYEPKETIKRIEAVGKVSFKDEPLCYGESDLYYLSRETWPLASTLMTDGFKPTIKYEAVRLAVLLSRYQMALKLLLPGVSLSTSLFRTSAQETGLEVLGKP